jgi:hypothetical protein
MKNDLHVLMDMFDRAEINFIVETNEDGWHRPLRVKGDDRCYVFDSEDDLCGIRSLDGCHSFDGD